MYFWTHQAGIWSRQFPTPCLAGERGRRFGVCYPLRCSGSPLSGSESGSRSANCSPSLYWPLKRGLRGAGSLMRRACAPVCIIRNRTSLAGLRPLITRCWMRPMYGVIGMLSVLMASDLTPEQRHYCTAARQSGESLLSIINQILDFSRNESGRASVSRAPFNLLAFFDEVISVFIPAAHEKGIRFELDIAPEIPCTLVTDADKLRQIVMNLLSNAIKFSESGAVMVTVRSAAPANASMAQAMGLTVRVADTGIGIPEDAQERIFTPFLQADASIARRFGGTGLGLAICKQLTELLEGDIHLHSVVGQGR